jgi:hypothetical protein
MWSTVGNTVGVVGVLINGIDYDVASAAIETAGVTSPAVGFNIVASGLASGTYTIQLRWKRTVGTGTLTRNIDRRLSMICKEVAV